MMAMASRTAGKANSTSIRFITIVSSRPPRSPTRTPSSVPTTRAMPTEKRPTSKEALAPCRMRLRMSRPKSSVPSQKVGLGGAKRLDICIAVGE